MDTTVIPSSMRLMHRVGLSPTQGEMRVGIKASLAVVVTAAVVYMAIGAYAAKLCFETVPGPFAGEKAFHCLIAFVYGPSMLPVYAVNHANAKRRGALVAGPGGSAMSPATM